MLGSGLFDCLPTPDTIFDGFITLRVRTGTEGGGGRVPVRTDALLGGTATPY
jgi:hypothetical protein